MILERRVPCVVALLACAGCQSAPAEPTPRNSLGVPTAEPILPERELARLDGRSPVPLLPVMALHQKQSMREHLESVQGIVAAAAKADFAGIERAASKIGYSEQTGQMCRHMGAGAPGFTDRALEFHHAADKISLAARQHDIVGVLSELGATLATCTGCHASYRQEVVGELPKGYP